MKDMDLSSFVRKTLKLPSDSKPSDGKVAIYARYSVPQKDMLDRQIKEVKDAATAVGDEDCTVYSDIGSGRDESRESLQSMLQEMRSHRYKKLYVKEADRISSDPQYLKDVLVELNDLGVEIISTSGI